jgi:hypothetical protein
MLSTDWRAPGTRTLARIPDQRVHQFWDPHHLVATALNQIVKQKPPQPAPACCFQKSSGFYWDDAILYPAGSHWKDPPSSTYWNGPVFRVVSGLEDSIIAQH